LSEPATPCHVCGEVPPEPRATCAACGAALFAQADGAAPSALPPLDALALVRVAHPGWATALSEALQAAGIQHRLAAETGAGRGDSLRFGVFVRPGDSAAAARLDAEVLREQLPDLPEGYDPAALPEGECPACGARIGGAEAECAECGLALIDA
jgi:hypothetical protein